ncbi:hypothetical protein ABTH44_18235, partial [Acinetobacter baumannii]
MKSKIFLGLISFISFSTYAATVPAEAFSRANCKFYVPGFGYGWYNESIEPYRVCRRVNILRDYPDDKIKIYP